MSGHFLHIGVGTGVPLLVSASLPESVVTSVTALTAHGSPFLDSMAHHLLHRNGMPDRVTLIRKPVEHVMMRGAGDAEERRPGAEALYFFFLKHRPRRHTLFYSRSLSLEEEEDEEYEEDEEEYEEGEFGRTSKKKT